MAIVTIDQSNFEQEVLNSDKPVLIDFWAAWCGPCRAVAPVVEEIAQKYGDKIKVGKINVDENRELAARYRIMGIPTLAIFKNGQEAQRTVGFQGKQQLERFVLSSIGQ